MSDSLHTGYGTVLAQPGLIRCWFRHQWVARVTRRETVSNGQDCRNHFSTGTVDLGYRRPPASGPVTTQRAGPQLPLLTISQDMQPNHHLGTTTDIIMTYRAVASWSGLGGAPVGYTLGGWDA